MIATYPDEAYIEFQSNSKSLMASEIREWLVNDYELLILPNNYMHIVNKVSRVVQCRRVFRGNTKILIPKYLLKVQQ